VESGKKGHGQFNHMQRSGDNNRLAPESGESAPLPAVVSLNRHGVAFTLEQIIFRYLHRINFPMVGKVKPDVPTFQTGQKTL